MSFSRALWNKACNELDWSTLEGMLVTHENEKKARFHARGNKALFLACKHGKANICALLLQNEKVVNCYPEQKEHIFRVTFASGHVDVLKSLVSTYKIKTFYTFEALGIAIEKGHVEMARYVLNTLHQGADLTQVAGNVTQNNQTCNQVFKNRQMFEFFYESGLLGGCVEHMRLNLAGIPNAFYVTTRKLENWLRYVTKLQQLIASVSQKCQISCFQSLVECVTPNLILRLQSLENHIVACLIHRVLGSLLYYYNTFGLTLIKYEKTLQMLDESFSDDKSLSLQWWQPFLPYGYIKIATRRQDIAKAKKTWTEKHRFGTSLAVGLAQLDLPVLLLMHLFYNMDTVCNCFDQHLVWTLMKTVKSSI